MMKKNRFLSTVMVLVLMVTVPMGCGEKENVKTETKTVTEITKTPTGISRLWGEERVTREEKFEVKTMNAPK